MKFSIDTPTFRNALIKVSRAIEPIEPARQMVLIEAIENRVVLRSFGGDTFCQRVVETPVENEGARAVRLEALIDFLTHAGEKVEISLAKNGRLVVSTGPLKGGFASDPYSDNYQEPRLDGAEWVPAGLARNIAYPGSAKGQCVHFSGHMISALHEVGLRFALTKTETDFGQGASIPGQFSPLLEGAEVAITKNKIWLRSEGFLAYVPAWAKMPPLEYLSIMDEFVLPQGEGFVVSASEMVSNLRGLKYFATLPSRKDVAYAKIVSDENGVIFLTPNSEVGYGTYRPNCNQFSTFEINIHLGFLIETLSNISRDQVVIAQAKLGSGLPLFVMPVDDSISEMHCIAPVLDQTFQTAKEELDAKDKPEQT